MTENTTPSFVSDDPLDDKPIWFPARPKSNGRSHQNSHLTRTLSFGSSTMHLSHFSNSPTSGTPCIISAVELILQLQKQLMMQFDLIGRHSKLRVISNRARHYLLWKLRRLGRKREMDQCPSSN